MSSLDFRGEFSHFHVFVLVEDAVYVADQVRSFVCNALLGSGLVKVVDGVDVYVNSRHLLLLESQVLDQTLAESSVSYLLLWRLFLWRYLFLELVFLLNVEDVVLYLSEVRSERLDEFSWARRPKLQAPSNRCDGDWEVGWAAVSTHVGTVLCLQLNLLDHASCTRGVAECILLATDPDVVEVDRVSVLLPDRPHKYFTRAVSKWSPDTLVNLSRGQQCLWCHVVIDLVVGNDFSLVTKLQELSIDPPVVIDDISECFNKFKR